MDDPNLKGFMSFASKQLHLNIPYFYLHKAGDDLSDLGPNVIPVCYGMEYSDLSNAVEDMANYRIRTRYRDSGIIRVNPYVKTRKSFTASYRLHYLNEFCKFVGREKELVELNKFCSADKELLWWSLVGKGGIGKPLFITIRKHLVKRAVKHFFYGNTFHSCHFRIAVAKNEIHTTTVRHGINAIVADIYNVAAAYDNSLADTQKILLRQSR